MTAYYVRAGTAGTDSGTSWANAAESIAALMASKILGGYDVIYVHVTHNFLAGGAITWTLPESGEGPLSVICVDGGDAAWSNPATMGTTVGSQTSGAVESTNGNFSFTINVSNSADACLFVHGMQIKAGAAGNSSGADIILGQTGGYAEFQNCTLWVDSTNVGAQILMGSTASVVGQRSRFNNTILKFGATGQSVVPNGGFIEFYGCKLEGTAPTTLFIPPASGKASIECHSCDWSSSTNVISLAANGQVIFRAHNCCIATPTTGTVTGPISAEFMACGAVDGTNGADILSYYKQDLFGVVEDDQSAYLTTGGAQGEQDDGTDTSYSLKMAPSGKVDQAFPLCTPWISTFVGSTGNKTITVKIAHTRVAAMSKGEVWMEVEYMGEPGATGTQRVDNSPMAQIEVDDDCPIQSGTIYRDLTTFGTGRTDTSVAWTGVTETETNTLTASINCAEVGYIRCRVCLGTYVGDATDPVYVDPKIGVA